MEPPLGPEELDAAKDMVLKILKEYRFRNILSERRPESRDYNCHGLCFCNRRGWLASDEDLDRILEEDGYRALGMRDVLPGDLVVYRNRRGAIDHTAIVVRIEEVMTPPLRIPWVLSKWGWLGEFVHCFSDYPLRDSKIEFRKEGG